MDVDKVQQSLKNTAQEVVECARKLGVEQAEAGISYDEGFSVTVRLGELESIERQRDRSLAVTVYVKGCKGSASTAECSSVAVEEMVRKAISIANFTSEDEYAGLAEPELMARELPDLDLYHPWAIGTVEAETIALRAEAAACGIDDRIKNSEGASVSTGKGVRVYANTHGFCEGYPTSSHSLSCGVIAEKDNSLERDYWFTVARAHQELDEPEKVGEEAASRTLRRLGARQIPTRSVPVVFPAELARGLFAHLVSAITGTSQYRKASFLLNAKGEQIFPDFIGIEEDPFIPRAMGSAAFDNEGVATHHRRLVEKGVLNGYVLSSYSARRLGMRTTGNSGGVHNLIVRPNAGSLDSLLKQCPEVFLVGELLGQGVNTVTGDYSRGAAGFWVEEGEIAYPVHEVTIAGNLREIFKGIRAVGSDVDLRGSIRCGSVLVEGLTVAGA
jgi:PmbA protein